MWFTNSFTGGIGRISPVDGAITEFAQPIAGTIPQGIATGPDGNLWFAESGTNVIGRITPSGVLAGYALPSAGAPRAITSGPDGNMWFTEYATGKIGRISTGVAPSPPAPPVTTPAAPTPTVTKPARTRLTVPKLHLRAIGTTRSIPTSCSRSVRGRCTVTATITGKLAKRLGLTRIVKKPFVLGRTTITLVKPGTRAVKLRVTAKTARALGGTTRVAITFRATGPKATTATLVRTVSR